MLRCLAFENGVLRLLDQRRLPGEAVWLELRNSGDVKDAIRDMAVRGAPAIGVAAAYGMALAALGGENMGVAYQELAGSRPTAVNLVWALDRIVGLGEVSAERVLAEAVAIEKEDLEMNLAIGRAGADLVPEGARVLTICNTGSLATSGHGTALGIIRSAWEMGKVEHVYSCETRPRQQGLRLTAFELMHDGIPFESIADSVAGMLMRAGKVDFVVAGADRIASNGDTANKIGTYVMAVLAKHHGIPFVIAAPYSTFDGSLKSGDEIPIEEREAEELTEVDGVRVGPEGVPVFNPAFDVTPGEMISAIVSERGVHRGPYSF